MRMMIRMVESMLASKASQRKILPPVPGVLVSHARCCGAGKQPGFGAKLHAAGAASRGRSPGSGGGIRAVLVGIAPRFGRRLRRFDARPIRNLLVRVHARCISNSLGIGLFLISEAPVARRNLRNAAEQARREERA